jgi:hypothetical protein
LTREAVREPEVVKQRADSYDFGVVSYALQLSEPDREEPGSDSMVEEKRFGMSPREVQCPGDKRRIDHRDATQDLRLSAGNGRLSYWRHGTSLP